MIFVIIGAVLVITAVAFVAAIKHSGSSPESDEKLQISKYLTEKHAQLAKLKSRAAVLKMDIDRYGQRIKDMDRQIDIYQNNAEKYVSKGDDIKARFELSEKLSCQQKRDSLYASYNQYTALYEKINLYVKEFSEDLAALEERRDEAIAKLEMARLREMMNEHETSGAALDRELSEYEMQNGL